jgi:hypothetical protein
VIAVGVDPAATGCAALAVVESSTDGPRLIGWRAIRRTSALRLPPWQLASHGYTDRVGDAVQARAWLVATNAHPDVIVVEETPAFVRVRASGGAVIAALVAQAEGAGAIVQALGEVERAGPDVWRPAVLRIPGNHPDAGKIAMAAWGWRHVDRPPLPWTGWVACSRPPDWAVEHVAEAACIAVWGMYRAGDP